MVRKKTDCDFLIDYLRVLDSGSTPDLLWPSSDVVQSLCGLHCASPCTRLSAETRRGRTGWCGVSSDAREICSAGTAA